MRGVPGVLLVVFLVTGCGPTVQEQRSARVEAIQLELDSVLETWRTDVSLRRFATSADAGQALASRYDMVYARWGLSPDLLVRATMAYAVAVAARVDRKELSVEEANALLRKMRVDVEQARKTLAGNTDSTAAREAAMLSWWTKYWTTNYQAYQVTSRNPVRCSTGPPQKAERSVLCQ